MNLLEEYSLQLWLWWPALILSWTAALYGKPMPLFLLHLLLYLLPAGWFFFADLDFSGLEVEVVNYLTIFGFLLTLGLFVLVMCFETGQRPTEEEAL